ncbi:hypothetical protein [Pontivivens ytuae]|uniref:Uncharacterized protein n=1 Tax=Pontivivens ytuae TaxID=2789856 RepID=A0A7S9LUH8_9RHOB|nr:hypothetical protein [Pontivivens ytuae]QPH55484.1 hypothetical protein I0K15_07040 [Pontivivens ytuae]
MLFHIKTLFVAPFVGLAGLLFAAPYFLLTVGLALWLPTVDLPEGAETFLRDLFNALPSRRGGPREPIEDPSLFIAMLVPIYFGILAVFRIHRGVVRAAGHGDTGRGWMVLVPERLWLLRLLLPLTVVALIWIGLLLVTGFHAPLLDELALPRLDAFAEAYGDHLLLVYASLMLIFAPFGLSLVKHAATLDLPFATFARGALHLLVFGAIFLGLALGLTLVIAEVALSQTGPTQRPIPVWMVFAVSAVLSWAMLTAASIRLLEHRLRREDPLD